MSLRYGPCPVHRYAAFPGSSSWCDRHGIATTAQGVGIDADPRIFALTVGIAASNSFLLPTHQCNAMVMGPGGYRVTNFLKVGGIMTVIFLTVTLVMLNLIY